MAFAYDQSRLESARHGISLSLPPSAGFSNAFSDGFFKGTHREKEGRRLFLGSFAGRKHESAPGELSWHFREQPLCAA